MFAIRAARSITRRRARRLQHDAAGERAVYRAFVQESGVWTAPVVFILEIDK